MAEFKEILSSSDQNEDIYFEDNISENKDKHDPLTSKCIKCGSYFSQSSEYHCSDCLISIKLEAKYETEILTIDDIIALPKCTFKKNKIINQLEIIFDDYKKKKNIKAKLIKNINEFKILENLCKDKSTGEVFAILDGHRDFPRCMLLAKYADKLLATCMNDMKIENKKYQYIHVIAPFIFDVWNMSSKHNVLLCYYLEFGQLTECPDNINTIYELWNRAVFTQFYNEMTEIKLCKCIYCYTDILSNYIKIKCKKCWNYIHIDCFNHRTTNMCKYCSNEWTNIDLKGYNDCGDIYIIR
jgi:hypothetical protein